MEKSVLVINAKLIFVKRLVAVGFDRSKRIRAARGAGREVRGAGRGLGATSPSCHKLQRHHRRHGHDTILHEEM
ncbi:hypothetical protein JYU34_002531 [Plutella xylostella]|uniref:Uncharacterized protein n=1 Tax=Plutella xylostella TaxID=51655 RepID=A0ABQ7R2M3_PLUXY|nr:hypothetical protein JYU34_002531 [Plutella xylostella]